MAKQNSKKNNSVNLLDLFFYLLSYWYWFVLGILVCGGVAAYKYATSTFIYRADATVIIKDPSTNKSSARLDTYNNLINKTSVSNEILEFKSRKLMSEVVRRLNADVSYKLGVKLRKIELYRSGSPVNVIFPESCKEQSVGTFTVTPQNAGQVSVKMGEKVKLVNLGDSLDCPCGKLVIVPSSIYGEEWYGRSIEVSKSTPTAMAAQLLSRLQIRQTEEESTILRFSLQDLSRERARDVLNMLFVVYNEEAIADKNQVAVNTAEFLADRISVIEQELLDVERELDAFKTRNVMMSAEEAASRYLSETQASTAVIAELETRLRLANYIRDYLNDAGKAEDMIPSNIGLDDMRIESQISQYNLTKMNRDRLMADSSSESPVVQSLDMSLKSMRESILRSIDNLVMSLEVKKADAEAKETEARSKFIQMPSTAREMISIERQQKIKESLYVFLLNRREENALTQAMVDNNAKVVDEADGPATHIAPSKAKWLLLGVLMGIAIPLVLLIARLFLDTRVWTRKEIEENVSAPFAGEIPEHKTKRKAKRRRKNKKDTLGDVLVYDRKSKGIMTESMRMLSTNLDFIRPAEAKGHVVTLSSFVTGSGKTFVAVNLAACAADGKKRVLLIDGDLRKRTLSRLFGLQHKTLGLSNYLYDSSVSTEDIIHAEVCPGVALIPAGMVPPNPVELLRRPRLDSLFAELREAYDLILIDNVPCDVVADSMVIDRVVDTTLFVIRAGKIDRRMLDNLEDMVDEGKFHNLCVLLNGSVIRRTYGFGGSYG